jgi:hypothetical protein
MESVMRTLFIAALAPALLAAALPAGAAQADAVNTISLSPDAQKTFETKYGLREVDTLDRAIRVSIAQALAARGLAERPDLRIEVTLDEATPTRPTFQQMIDNVSLDMRSVSLGGAALQARLVNAQGETVDTVKFRWYEYDLRNAFSSATWDDARQAIHLFARKVAQAYAAHA